MGKKIRKNVKMYNKNVYRIKFVLYICEKSFNAIVLSENEIAKRISILLLVV